MTVILLAEDDPIQRRAVRRMLESEFSATILEAEDGADALRHLKSEAGPAINLALIDLAMPVMDGLNLLKLGRGLHPALPFIILTGSEKLDDAVEAMRLGAADFIAKPAEKTRLVASARNALALRSLQQEVGRLRTSPVGGLRLAEVVETAPDLADVVAIAHKAARSDIPVLITGESGVGKEVFAHAIHLESARADRPFISVNCGALPENLVESTLFGHEKGSFTGATARSLGKCREAEGGVLFLDEVGELRLDAQVKLLRLLQEGEIEPVGSSKPVRVNVRIISATNRSLEAMVETGRFREDLYYRLHGLPIHLPPLRERRRDILPLAARLLERLACARGGRMCALPNRRATGC